MNPNAKDALLVHANFKLPFLVKLRILFSTNIEIRTRVNFFDHEVGYHQAEPTELETFSIVDTLRWKWRLWRSRGNKGGSMAINTSN